ncbi:PE domain-containing protein [Saccharothrix sp. S26]|uniref:PE domain-containing protein n=1 Tax=Saccharothrix sp. S26 TaxID=2907215 RepID=UPI001F32CA50|nr:PE domain-containing protein [Saccharothrix sp. S26]MCE6999834.1 PE domain-containing protein [Saccharothrix sp. S26]
MPFMASGGGVGAPAPAGPVTMQVEPGQILALKARYEAVRDTIRDFVDLEGYNLIGNPLAEDDVSKDAASVFRENADTAIEVARHFISELNRSIEQLDQAARTYGLAEDTNKTNIQQTGGI